MKKIVVKIILVAITIVLVNPLSVSAQKGCCSRHGGVTNSCSGGKQVCADGTVSKTCICENYSYSNNNGNSSSNYYENTAPAITYVYGCTDVNAINYNQQANSNDHSCQYQKEVSEIEKIEYKIKKVNTSNLKTGKEEVQTKGKDGEKKVTYIVTTDESGKELKRVEKESTIILEPTTEIIKVGTKIENSSDNPIIGYAWLISLVIVFTYSSVNKKEKLLVNKIKNKNGIQRILLYVVYIILIIPSFIDSFLIIKKGWQKHQTTK